MNNTIFLNAWLAIERHKRRAARREKLAPQRRRRELRIITDVLLSRRK
jgi:hypothetical protein